jgi:RNA polymerase sigma-70 factor (ECF subfamily)
MLAMSDMEPLVGKPEALGLEADGFRRFYDAALPRVYGYLLHRCGGFTSIAEDLTQETFLAAVGELRRGRRIDAPLPWIYGIARHKLLDHYRRQERSARITFSESEAMHATRADDVDDRALAALAAVPPAQRIALVLRHVDGLSVPEVAAALGRSIEAVESLLVRGRVGFRRAYAEALR